MLFCSRFLYLTWSAFKQLHDSLVTRMVSHVISYSENFMTNLFLIVRSFHRKWFVDLFNPHMATKHDVHVNEQLFVVGIKLHLKIVGLSTNLNFRFPFGGALQTHMNHLQSFAFNFPSTI